ncbi:lasso peptide biosynthesis B2 protein [Streptomyces hesseae]|uniref:Lasso peptide biosynthesis B2 protein n=1 Tax=Streptomyces hesseae TaxID=3075519 RepID=A0ABU2SI69_9ACTN|nr:lasso peptide biosynthesis B2 protein [Streptomyces sp. DSM 40473]MDT0447770.1 lasso peptide biosynthesis B2 protein [Streptomyces sp. DSM 40473]
MESYSTVRTGLFRDRLAAAMGLALALALLGLPFCFTVRAARIARRAGRRPIGHDRAEALVAAVRHTGRLWPVRAACVEISLGAVLAAALLGCRLNWCLGVRFSPPPTEYHAWAGLPGGGPVGEYTEAGWHHYTALVI